MPREKSRYRDRDRRSLSYSSESSYDRKKSKSKHKRRSRSRDRSKSSSHKRKRSTSRSRHGRRSYSRSVSRDRYESKSSRRRSSSRSRGGKSSKRSHSRSSSTPKHSRRHRKRSPSSDSRSPSVEIVKPQLKVNLDDSETKLEKAIKAAEAAGLTMTRIPTYEYKEVEIKEDMPTITDRNLLAEINNDSFVQKSFTSSRSKKQNIVIDLNAQTVTVPEAEAKAKDDSIIDFDELPSEEELKEMWVKKLFLLRKKMLKGEL